MIAAQPKVPRILVVEDEPDIVESLVHVFGREGFSTDAALDAEAALDKIKAEPPDVLLLDLMLPGMSGLEVLKTLRRDEKYADTRVIIVTARHEEVDRILGFEFGADDYVTKPFSPRELVLRVRAVLQRAGAGRSGPDTEDVNVLTAGPIEIDMEYHNVKVDGTALDLTLTEFRLLSELVRARGRVRSREYLLSEVWGYDTEVMSRTVDTHIRRLRTKLGRASSWLSTVRGVGYRLQRPGADAR